MTNRRTFLTHAAAFGGLLPLVPTFSFGNTSVTADPIPSTAVQEFVRVAHSDFDRTKAILEEYPHILNAAWDWGDGDFETAIGAAGHMGHRDFALFLLDKGARADVFVLTMLGETQLVKPMLEKYPQLLPSLGPHGFTLLHHAQKGGDPAAELAEYLKSKGMTESFVKYYTK